MKIRNVDIIIPIRNQLKMTMACIDSIYLHTNEAVNLILVDDASEDKGLIAYLAKLKNTRKNITLLRNKTNVGRTKSVNRGLRASRSDIVVILDNDTLMAPEWLKKLKQCLFSSPDIGITGPRMNNRFSQIQDLPYQPRSLEPNIINLEIKMINDHLKQDEHTQYPCSPYVFGACMMIKRSVIKKCGYFDEIFDESKAGYFDDIDLCFRAAKAGFEIKVANDLFIYHYNGASYADHKERLADIKRAYGLLDAKWHNAPQLTAIPDKLKKIRKPKNLIDSKNGWYFKRSKRTSMSKNYLLINPPTEDTSEYTVFNKNADPHGLLRIAHSLIEEGHRVFLYDFRPTDSMPKYVRRARCGDGRIKKIYYYGKPYSAFTRKLRLLKNVGHVFITTIMTYHYDHTLKNVVKIVKKILPNAQITVGGIYASLCPDEIAKIEGANVHIGPFKEADNKFPLIELLDKKPKTGILRLAKGCPRHCSYCAVPQLEGGFKNFGLPRLIEEFQYYVKRGVTNFSFWDSNLLFAKKDFSGFLAYLIKYGYDASMTIDLSYGIEMGLLDRKTMRLLKKLKLCDAFLLPLESSVPRLFHDRFHKRADHVEKICKTAEWIINDLKRPCAFYLLAGLPGQTLHEIIETAYFGFVRGWYLSVMLFTPIPCTEEYRKHYDSIKNKTMAELNPNLFPFADENCTSKDLQNILNSLHASTLAYEKDAGIVIKKMDKNRKIKKNYTILNRKNTITTTLRGMLYKERLDPLVDDVPFYAEKIKEHLARYRFAKTYAKGRILDIGCGTGYGLDLCGNDGNAQKLGIDISKESIALANQHFKKHNVNFKHADFLSWKTQGQFDTIITFECIEHIDKKDRKSFLKKIADLMSDDATFVISTVLNEKGACNPFHEQKISHGVLIKSLSNFFTISLFKQYDDNILACTPGDLTGPSTMAVAVCKRHNKRTLSA